jgi:hypothetical protein
MVHRTPRISRTRRKFVDACHAKHFDACVWLPSGDAWEVGWDNGLIGFDLRDHHIDAIGPACINIVEASPRRGAPPG